MKQTTLRPEHRLSVPYMSLGHGYNWVVVSASGDVSVEICNTEGQVLLRAGPAEFVSVGAFVPVDSKFELHVDNECDTKLTIEYRVASVPSPDYQGYVGIERRATGAAGCLSYALVLLSLLVLACVAFA